MCCAKNKQHISSPPITIVFTINLKKIYNRIEYIQGVFIIILKHKVRTRGNNEREKKEGNFVRNQSKIKFVFCRLNRSQFFFTTEQKKYAIFVVVCQFNSSSTSFKHYHHHYYDFSFLFCSAIYCFSNN